MARPNSYRLLPGPITRSCIRTVTVDAYGRRRQGSSIALADRLDSPASSAVRYAT